MSCALTSRPSPAVRHATADHGLARLLTDHWCMQCLLSGTGSRSCVSDAWHDAESSSWTLQARLLRPVQALAERASWSMLNKHCGHGEHARLWAPLWPALQLTSHDALAQAPRQDQIRKTKRRMARLRQSHLRCLASSLSLLVGRRRQRPTRRPEAARMRSLRRRCPQPVAAHASIHRLPGFPTLCGSQLCCCNCCCCVNSQCHIE